MAEGVVVALEGIRDNRTRPDAKDPCFIEAYEGREEIW